VSCRQVTTNMRDVIYVRAAFQASEKDEMAICEHQWACRRAQAFSPSSGRAQDCAWNRNFAACISDRTAIPAAEIAYYVHVCTACMHCMYAVHVRTLYKSRGLKCSTLHIYKHRWCNMACSLATNIYSHLTVLS
jgi:hypothetical protein